MKTRSKLRILFVVGVMSAIGVEYMMHVYHSEVMSWVMVAILGVSWGAFLHITDGIK